jgi:DNA-binding transcriptional LysR family regulator
MDPTRADLKLLRLFEVLYSTRSVTRTAEALGQTQPTVSIGLARLRREFDDPLFVRTPAGMQPTPRADALIDTVREVLAAMRRLAETGSSFEPARAQREFRIFMTDASHITLLPQLFSHVRALAPGVWLEAAAIGPHMAEALQSGEADLALGLIPGLEAGFYQQALYDQDWVCLANARHPRAGKSFTLKAYQQESHVEIVSGTGQLVLERALSEHGVVRPIALKLPGFLGLPAILSTTDLVATLPRHIGETLAQGGALQVLRCPVPIPGFTVKQHWHARYHHDAASRWLRQVCAELFMRPQQPRRARR